MKKENSNSGKSDLRLPKGEEKLNKKQSAKPVQLNDADTSKLIHELRAHQIELEIQNEKLRVAIDKEKAASSIYDFSPSGYFTLNRNGAICQLNLSAASLVGQERTRLVNRSFMQFVSRETLLDFQNFIRLIFESRSKQTCEAWLTVKGGPSVFVHLEGLISEDEQKCHVTAVDITVHKQMEVKLRESETQLKMTMKETQTGLWEWNLKKDQWNASAQYYTMLGYDPVAPPSDRSVWLDRVHPDDREFVSRKIKNILSGKESKYLYEARMRHADGTYRWHSVSGFVVEHDNHGKATRMFGTRSDITDRVRAEEAMKASEARYRRLFESAKDGILILNAETGQIVDVNPFLFQILGYSHDELLGKELWEIGVFKNIADSKEAFIELQNKGYIRFEDMPLETKNGKIINVEFVSNVYLVDQIKVIQCNIRDITKRKKTEKEIKTLGKAIEQGPSSVVITDAKGKIEFVNNKFTSLTQYRLEDVRGRKPRIFNPGHLTEKEFEMLWKTLQKGDTWKGEVLDHKKDKSHFWEEVNISAVMNPDGTIENYILILNNISEKKQMLNDLVAAKEKAEEGNRLKSAFLSNMSHEIRTPMNAIMGFSALMKEAEGDEKNTYADIVWNSSEKLLLLIDDIILLSRLQSEKMPVINNGFSPAGLVTEVSRMINLPEFKKKLNIKVNIPEQHKDLILRSDAAKIKLALTNLASNAVRYTLEGSVELGFDLLDGKVEFYVKDTGIGIPEQEKQKIFETFYRGKQAILSAIGGTGLGLCIARELIELLHGEIGLTSTLNKGSRFYFTIPLEQGELGQSEKHSNRTVKKDWMDISILIADDEPINFKYFEILLRGKVKNIDHAVNGKEAVEMASRNSYNLILMDMKMPVMGGIEATKILKQRFPELSIIAQTAYTFPEEKEIAIQAGCDDCLTKPIKKGDLIEIINKYI